MPKPLLAAFAVILLLVGGLFGFSVGAGKAQPQWKQIPAHVSVEAQKASFEAEDFTYGFQGTIVWVDAEGELQDAGWPACLTDRTTSARILVPTRSVDVAGTGLRPVLAVDCRG